MKFGKKRGFNLAELQKYKISVHKREIRCFQDDKPCFVRLL
jgi:hypothetical protein